MFFINKYTLLLAVIIFGLVQIKSPTEDLVMIPQEAIRVRVIANSNTIDDQGTKLKIVAKIETLFKSLISKDTSYDEAKIIINKNILKIENIIEEITGSKNYKINYGNNYFPKKIFKGTLYKEGNYESLLITLGKGNGDNWWCVLFPPLCLIDMKSNASNIEYKLLIKEIFNLR